VNAILLHPFCSEPKFIPRQRETWAFFRTNQYALAAAGIVVVHYPTPTDDPSSLYKALRWAWKTGETVVTVEQDILPSMFQVLALVGCTEKWCAGNYPVASKERERPSTYDVHRLILDRAPEHYTSCRVKNEDGTLRWVRRDETWADFSPTGLIKWSGRLTSGHPVWHTSSFGDDDLKMSDHLRSLGLRCHVHPGRAEHCHPYTDGDWLDVMLADANQVED
jgi:hypothetical protein